ncbi:TPA: hypothetical protein ACK3Q6_007506 [Burkholderia cepacia]|uniref:hypothetical protein n=1 Tax=Burkholderia cepacia complex TaxID=87882 RepID=UPI001CF191F0|nr:MULTISPECIES: hypothetical protein [Burkholderia cepacia complex]HDR9763951.1 hypothetical protein [Burkholderia cepacia ATCC 25416]MCA8361298.1 hypothetical protein [Burkholderia cepacia]MCW3498757.1 hypothetical protein [Burkholderia cenocepacia]MCW3506155.1 hypothetical protein [Burkholderia cenocepacia]MCW3513910.1 hypothetical protein [Burkholderia cenocepacia]
MKTIEFYSLTVIGLVSIALSAYLIGLQTKANIQPQNQTMTFKPTREFVIAKEIISSLSTTKPIAEGSHE